MAVRILAPKAGGVERLDLGPIGPSQVYDDGLATEGTPLPKGVQARSARHLHSVGSSARRPLAPDLNPPFDPYEGPRTDLFEYYRDDEGNVSPVQTSWEPQAAPNQQVGRLEPKPLGSKRDGLTRPATPTTAGTDTNGGFYNYQGDPFFDPRLQTLLFGPESEDPIRAKEVDQAIKEQQAARRNAATTPSTEKGPTTGVVAISSTKPKPQELFDWVDYESRPYDGAQDETPGNADDWARDAAKRSIGLSKEVAQKAQMQAEEAKVGHDVDHTMATEDFKDELTRITANYRQAQSGKRNHDLEKDLSATLDKVGRARGWSDAETEAAKWRTNLQLNLATMNSAELKNIFDIWKAQYENARAAGDNPALEDIERMASDFKQELAARHISGAEELAHIAHQESLQNMTTQQLLIHRREYAKAIAAGRERGVSETEIALLKAKMAELFEVFAQKAGLNATQREEQFSIWFGDTEPANGSAAPAKVSRLKFLSEKLLNAREKRHQSRVTVAKSRVKAPQPTSIEVRKSRNKLTAPLVGAVAVVLAGAITAGPLVDKVKAVLRHPTTAALGRWTEAQPSKAVDLQGATSLWELASILSPEENPMATLENAAGAAEAQGHTVELVGSGTRRVLFIDGQSDLQGLANVLFGAPN